MESLKPPLLVTMLMLLASPTLAVNGDDPVKSAFAQCKNIDDAAARLRCYDDLVIDELMATDEPRFAGKHTLKTDPFTITQPTQLRYQSDGVIFVMAVFNEQGEIIENLHIGGGGEGRYLLESPGRYYLQMNGSTTWRVWFESPPK